MDINEDERAWSRLDDRAIIFHARGEDMADESLWPGRVQLVTDGVGVPFQAVAPAGAVRSSLQPGGEQQSRPAEHEPDSMP